jgi:8-oxo-dGTP pyrophosphatase MutT (NUDIX family)
VTHEPGITRDFTTAVFVVHGGRVLLHWHVKLSRWLPPGGHIDPNEIPDEAALREVMEETGVEATLVGNPAIAVELPGQPKQLCPPAGIQITAIVPGHEHIDIVYFATGRPVAERPDVGWFGPDDWGPLALTEEITAWCEAALTALEGK